MSPLPFVRAASAVACLFALGACDSSTPAAAEPGVFDVPVRHVVSGPDGFHAYSLAFGVDHPKYPYESQELHNFQALSDSVNADSGLRVGVMVPSALREAPFWAVGRTEREHWLGGHDTHFPTSSDARRLDLEDLNLPPHMTDEIGTAFEVRSRTTSDVGIAVYGCRGDLCYLAQANGPDDGSARADALYIDLLSNLTIES